MAVVEFSYSQEHVSAPTKNGQRCTTALMFAIVGIVGRGAVEKDSLVVRHSLV
jgi:hypothetical protein